MRLFIRQKNNKYYLVRRFYENGKQRERWYQLDDTDTEKILKALNIKRELLGQTVEITCANPNCSKTIKLTPEQKRDFLISFKKKYDKIVLACCSKECQSRVLEILKS